MSSSSKSVLTFFLLRTIDRYRRTLMQLVRIRGTMAYVEVVQVVRRISMILVVATACVGLLAVGFVFLHVALLMAVDWTVKQKALFLLIAGLVYMGVPLAALRYYLSEKYWMEVTNAETLIDCVTDGKQK